MISYKETNEEVRGFEDKSSKVELVTNNLARQILCKHDYTPVTLLNYSKKLFSGGLSCLNPGTDYGTDDIIFIEDIPSKDPFNFRETRPFSPSVGVYSIDYKSHQFRDNEINIMLMKLRESGFYTAERYDKLLKRGKAGKYRVQGSLSTEKQTDFFFFVKRANKKYYPDKEPNSLVNAYIIPALSLNKLIINNLNIIREYHDLIPLELKENDKEKTFKMYQTWNLYRETKFKVKKEYPFKLFRLKDYRPSQYDSLMMKIPDRYLLNYIKFNENGEIIEIKN
jgi:hypothetical protein